ncbi:hypothetical protein CYY_001061 [Polysphondylium violaceum]|uniref:Peroxin 19 n=1 Tax=Polysphondylium violaceum TaxID=133409 RepID=A0A8J4PYQ1_9MYCE|nr:hypothetical protein CYY_001061 [Polysphondylium violaceum]
MDLDDLLNSALDELEVQEKEQPTPPPPAVVKPAAPAVNTNVNKTTTATPSTSNNNSNSFPAAAGGFGGMEEMFKAMMGGEDAFKNLFGADGSMKPGSEGDMESLTADLEKFTSQLNSLLAEETFDESKLNEFANAFNLPTDFNNKNNTATTTTTTSTNTTNTTPPQGISIDNFQDHISATLKNLASDASKPQDEGIPPGLEEMFAQLSKVLDETNLNEGDGDEINNFFEGTMQYLGKNYPEWIERNKDKYSAQDIERFTKQSELFKVLLNNEDLDKNENLFTKLSEYGSLPEEFTDEYLASLEKDQQQLQQEQQQTTQDTKSTTTTTTPTEENK